MLTPDQRSFGVEIECIVPGHTPTQVAAAIAADGIACRFEGYNHRVSNSWKIVTDASVHGAGNAMEVVSPPLHSNNGHEQVAKVCATLQRLGAMVNRSCGLHVHVGANEISTASMRKLAAMYMENENVLDSWLPTSRRASNNTYCASVATNTNVQRLQVATNATQIAQAINNGSRFVKLNFASFWKYGTIEFRHHSGTVDARKIKMWVMACQRMVCTADAEQATPITLATTQRPQGYGKSARRLRTIYDLLARPEGCTRQDVATALGRSTMPPLNRILANAGFTYRENTRRRVARYTLEATPTTQANTATNESFMARLQMTEEETTFWVERVALLRSAQTRNQVAA